MALLSYVLGRAERAPIKVSEKEAKKRRKRSEHDCAKVEKRDKRSRDAIRGKFVLTSFGNRRERERERGREGEREARP